MKLAEYISAERGSASRLAIELGVSMSYLYQMANGIRPVSPARAVRIEELTNKSVSRQETRDDWRLIWPELVNA